ncbi:MAG: hypothetical protein ABIW84_09785, partial [Ilumatobacteraceae bacterium]
MDDDTGTRVSAIAGVVASLDHLDCSLMCRVDINASLGELARVHSWYHATHAKLTRRLTELAEANAAIVPAADIAACGRGSRKDADQAVRRASVLGDAPQMEQALNDGDVSAAHIDA